MPHKSWLFVTLLMTACRTASGPALDEVKNTEGEKKAAKIQVIAHRGHSAVAPENTIPAFEAAIKAGSTLIELDYHQSSDGVPVVIHDGTLDRTTNAKTLLKKEKIAVNKTSLAIIRKLDAGAWFNKSFAGTKVPTLEEALAIIQKDATTLIERKGGDAATLHKVLEGLNLSEKVVVQAFDWKFLKDLRKLNAKVPLVALGDKEFNENLYKELAAMKLHGVAWAYTKLNKGAVERLHAMGLKVFVWTVNDMKLAKDMAALGLDGIITDKPADVKKLF